MREFETCSAQRQARITNKKPGDQAGLKFREKQAR
jgi:hypothetical protein